MAPVLNHLSPLDVKVGRRLGEIVVVTCYRSFLSLVVQKIYGVTTCGTNDYKVFGKTGKHKKDLKSNKPDSLTDELEFGLGKIGSVQMRLCSNVILKMLRFINQGGYSIFLYWTVLMSACSR